jgi:gas vesicle protein
MHEYQETHTAPIVYFFLGGLVGASAALLFAPQSGRDTREQLGQRLRRTADSARDLKDAAVHKGEQLKESATRLKERAVSKLSGRPGEASSYESAPLAEDLA